MKVTVTFPEIVETYEMPEGLTRGEFLKDPEAWLDCDVSDVHHEYDWEIEDEDAQIQG